MSDFTVADVLAWARTKPADETYYYADPGNCAICQFLRETGRATEPRVIKAGWRDGITTAIRIPYPSEIADAANIGPIHSTFAEFVTRLERLCPETPVIASDWAAIDTYLTDIEQVEA